MNGRRIGFIGLGNMGGRIARRLATAGHAVAGYDAVSGRAAESGVEAMASIEQVARCSDIVFLSLPDSAAVERVVAGTGGLRESAKPGSTVIDLSTSAPRSTIALHDRLARAGITFMDAGVSGGAAAAEKGTLTLMVGGARDKFDAVRWAFHPFSQHVLHMGPCGAGHMAKLLNNFLNAVSLSATAEVMVAGKKAGLDLDLLLDALNSSSGVNFATLNRFPKIVHGDYLEGGLTGQLMTKDILLYVDAVRELGVASLNAAGPLASFGMATALGYGGAISNRVVDAIGDLSGGVRLHAGPTSPA